MATRSRVSLLKEDRIWDLRSQGYLYEHIARITNLAPNSMTTILRRVRRRPPLEVDPIRRGRRCGWLSDAQVEDIRARRAAGEPLHSLANAYAMSPSAISSIAHGRSYSTTESGTPYPFSFANRLAA